MKKEELFVAKLPAQLKAHVDAVCRFLGVRRDRLVEEAIREKLEDLLDAHDLRRARKESTGFHPWRSVEKGATARPRDARRWS